MIQSGREGIKGPSTVPQGGTINVVVGTGDGAATVEVSVAGRPDTTSHPVGPDKKAAIPVPPVPAGTLLFVSVGQGSKAHVIVIEVVATF